MPGEANQPAIRCLKIRTAADVSAARLAARQMAQQCGLSRLAIERFVLAVAELATNLARYADAGEIELRPAPPGTRPGVEVESRDAGPGIADLDLAFQEGYSTGGGLGCGLPGVRRLVDEFTIATSPRGTRIVARQWATRASR